MAPTILLTLTGDAPHLVGFDRGFSILHVRRFAPHRAPGPRCLDGPYQPQPRMNTLTPYALNPATRALYVCARTALDPARDLHLPLAWSPGERVQLRLAAPPPAPPLTPTRLAQLFDSVPWIFASSYAATNPHWYSRRRDWSDDSAFTWAIEQVQRLGHRRRFEGAWWTQLDVGGHYYWAGFERPATTKWLNRKPLEAPPVPIAVRQTLIAADACRLAIPTLPDGWHGLPVGVTRDAHFRFGVATFGYPEGTA